jgi:hypothetical protein
VTNSILNSVKKVLGMEASYTAFDTDVLMHINTAFSTLHQLGVGPPDAFVVSNSTPEWSSFIASVDGIEAVRSYVFLRVRLLFDPPTTSFGITAMENMVKEMEWRLNAVVDVGEDEDPEVAQAYWWDVTGLSDFPVEAAIGDLGIDLVTGDAWRYGP